jgi:hypothetical protein
MRTAKLILLVIVALAFASMACKNANFTPQQQTVVNIQQALEFTSSINEAVTTQVILAQQQGVISVDLTRQILTYTKSVANGVLAAETVANGSLPIDQKVQGVLAAMQGIALPDNVKTFLAAPQTQPTVVGLINTIVQLENAIVKLKAGPTVAPTGGAQ